MDGFFQPCNCPTLKESNGNPRTCFSGHCSQHGLNCQAVCDANLRFIFFAVVAPGKEHDARACLKTGLDEIIENFATGTCIVGDAAYCITENLIVPFTGSARDNPDIDAFNFHLSQVRIRIEMAFGLLTTKWRILRRKLETSLKTSSAIIEACSRMHNFI